VRRRDAGPDLPARGRSPECRAGARSRDRIRRCPPLLHGCLSLARARQAAGRCAR
jgi:hypothetical protein